MTWFRVDDKLHDHPKVRKLRADKVPAIGLWSLAGSWAADNLTDGFVPAEIVQRYDPRQRYAARLVDVGLWIPAEHDGEEGYRFHEWGDWQPTRADVQKQREDSKERVRRWRERNGQATPLAETAGNSVAPPGGNAPGNALPAHCVTEAVTPPPTRPDQYQTKEQEQTLALAPLADHETVSDSHDHESQPALLESQASSAAVVPISRKADETFTRFWAIYPRKKAKPEARKAWDKAIKRATTEQIITAAQNLAATNPDLKYTPYPATWLNRDSWNDEPDPTSRPTHVGYQQPPNANYEGSLLP